MTRKTMKAKFAAFLATVILMSGLFSGKIMILNTSAMAEEDRRQVVETDLQIVMAETAPDETKAADQQTVEPDGETTEQPAEEDAGLEPAGEETVPASETEDENGKEEIPEMPSGDDSESAAEPEDEKEEEIPEAPSGDDSESDAEPEDEKEEEIPEAPSGDNSESAAEPEDEKEEETPEAPSGDDSENAGISGDEEELTVIDDDDAGSVSNEILDPFNNPDLYEKQEFLGTAEIRLVNKGKLGYGDEIILKADVRNMNVSYRLVWEANDNDGAGWCAVGSGEEYRFILNRENAGREYRIVVYAVD